MARKITEALMLNHLRTLSAHLVTRYKIGPRDLQIRAWAWLAAETSDLRAKERCLEAIVALDPHLEWAQIALEDMRHWRARVN